MLIGTASALSVVVSASVRAPLDNIKTQIQAGSATSLCAVLRDSVRGPTNALRAGCSRCTAAWGSR